MWYNILVWPLSQGNSDILRLREKIPKHKKAPRWGVLSPTDTNMDCGDFSKYALQYQVYYVHHVQLHIITSPTKYKYTASKYQFAWKKFRQPWPKSGTVLDWSHNVVEDEKESMWDNGITLFDAQTTYETILPDYARAWEGRWSGYTNAFKWPKRK